MRPLSILEHPEMDDDRQATVGSFIWKSQALQLDRRLFFNLDTKVYDQMIRHIAFISRLRHPNIITAMGAVTVGPNDDLPFVAPTSADVDHLKEGAAGSALRAKLRVRERTLLAIQVLRPLLYLQTQNPVILHRNIGPASYFLAVPFNAVYTFLEDDNVWHPSYHVLKLGEFSLAKEDSGPTSSSAHLASLTSDNVDFVEPEVRDENRPHSSESDAYAAGLTVFELATFTKFDRRSGVQLSCV